MIATSQIDAGGRIIDLEANKAKLSIIEQEFKAAEQEELERLKEEEEMRVRKMILQPLQHNTTRFVGLKKTHSNTCG